MRDPNEPSMFDHNAPYNEGEDGQCDCFTCRRERRREAEAEREDFIRDEMKEENRWNT